MAIVDAVILLVDDVEDGRDIYSTYLTFKGYSVICAANGDEALARAREHRPDLILMDLSMPGLTGTQAMRALRADDRFRSVPIVALTAHALDDERREALQAGFDAVITKPCLPDELLAAIEALFRTRRTP
jgi:CheY-like chemotaxis protein